jgi:DNA-binding Xre family transcriptional regulator
VNSTSVKNVSRRFVLLSCLALPALPAVIGTAAEKGRRVGILKVLARNVWTWRILRGHNQEQLARRCGFTNECMSQIERASYPVTLANLSELADQLECTACDLVKY